MRVTFNSTPDSVTRQLGLLTSQLAQLQMQAASGQRIQLPSDDPVAMQRVLRAQAEQSALTQYQTNIARLQEQATTAGTAMSGLKTISDRVGEIATLVNGVTSPADLKDYATEVSQLIQQAVQTANVQDQGRYLFSGTASDMPPYAVTTDANGYVTGVTYQGNTTAAPIPISSTVNLSATPVGENTTGTGPSGLITDSRTGADFFNHLIALQNDLLAGSTDAVHTTDQPALKIDEDHLIYQVADNQSLQANLQAADSLASDRLGALKQFISHDVDIDLAQTAVQISKTQVAYQAALQTTGNLLNLSLLNYLH